MGVLFSRGASEGDGEAADLRFQRNGWPGRTYIVCASMLTIGRCQGCSVKGAIPSFRIGAHRRVQYGDVMTHKRERDEWHREGPGRLAPMSEELSLYE